MSRRVRASQWLAVAGCVEDGVVAAHPRHVGIDLRRRNDVLVVPEMRMPVRPTDRK